VMESVVEGKGTDSESNSFDKRDDMSEDELTVLGGKIGDADNVTIDESDDSKSKKGVKRRHKKVKTAEMSKKGKSKVWDVFTKVNVSDPSEKGKMISKAKCNYCKKLYSYIQGSTTSHLSRHMKISDGYLKHVAQKLDQSLLNFAPSMAGESGSGLPPITSSKYYNHEQVKKLIAKMIIVHEYPFRMVEHTWFNIVMRQKMLKTDLMLPHLRVLKDHVVCHLLHVNFSHSCLQLNLTHQRASC
jgi:ribosomal protein L32